MLRIGSKEQLLHLKEEYMIARCIRGTHYYQFISMTYLCLWEKGSQPSKTSPSDSHIAQVFRTFSFVKLLKLGTSCLRVIQKNWCMHLSCQNWSTIILCQWAVPKKSRKSLQLFQNGAARVLMITNRRDHIFPVSASLHWVPVQSRIKF